MFKFNSCPYSTLLTMCQHRTASRTLTLEFWASKYRAIQNDCRGFNNLSYKIHFEIGVYLFLFNRTTLQGFVTYLTGALYVHPLWFYKHQHDNRIHSKLFVACQRWWFRWRFWFVPSVPGYTGTLCLETVQTTFEWNCQMVVVSRIWWGIAAGHLNPDKHFE